MKSPTRKKFDLYQSSEHEELGVGERRVCSQNFFFQSACRGEACLQGTWCEYRGEGLLLNLKGFPKFFNSLMGWFFWPLAKSCDACEVLQTDGEVPMVSLLFFFIIIIAN